MENFEAIKTVMANWPDQRPGEQSISLVLSDGDDDGQWQSAVTKL